ncbi:MAG: ChuX/HutX family heme-like substrate-binding protein [Cereibacter changlensis]
MTPDDIRQARARAPRPRPRDFAEGLGIAEAALAAAFAGPQVVRIAAAPDRLLPLAAGLGEALALTRNGSAVQERHGRFEGYDPKAARIYGPEIELHLAPAHWMHGFAVTEPTAKATKRSLQIFDAAGDAVHKIHLTEASDVAAFARLVESLRLADPSDHLPLAPRAPEPAVVPRLKLRRLSAEAVTHLLERSAARGIGLRIAVGNPGCTQIYSGPVHSIVPTGHWINVMDPRFNLHLRTDHLAQVWLTGQSAAPTLQALDGSGRLILQIDARQASLALWQEMVGTLDCAQGMPSQK